MNYRYLTVAFLSFLSVQADIPCLDFDQAMGLRQYPDVVKTAARQNIYGFLKRLYLKNGPDMAPRSSTLKIPKIIHMVWFGGKLPVEFVSYCQSWKTFHPDWTFVFWTDSPANYDQGELVCDFDELATRLKSSDCAGKSFVMNVTNLSYDNKRFYDATKNYGERSDIIKWEVVYRFGGLYVDTDFECLQPLDELHYMYDFYTGILPLENNSVQLGAALFGAVPGHPILKRCVETIKDNQQETQIIDRTGPVHFTICFLRTAGRNGLCDIAFPAAYFYPLYIAEIDKLLSQEDVGYQKEELKRQGAKAIHFWARSWMPKAQRSEAFKNLNSKPFIGVPNENV